MLVGTAVCKGVAGTVAGVEAVLEAAGFAGVASEAVAVGCVVGAEGVAPDWDPVV